MLFVICHFLNEKGIPYIRLDRHTLSKGISYIKLDRHTLSVLSIYLNLGALFELDKKVIITNCVCKLVFKNK